MSRFRVGFVSVAFLLFATAIPVVLTGGGVAAAAPDPSVETACAGTVSGSIFTLTANCDTTAPLTVPNGVTLIGAGHTITAHDTTPGIVRRRSVVECWFVDECRGRDDHGHRLRNPPPSAENGFAACTRTSLYGIWFNGAGGSVTNVVVTGITEGSNCQVGRAIVGDGTAAQTLTITGTTVSDYNKDAIHAVRDDHERLG